jgi:hypothetical protein
MLNFTTEDEALQAANIADSVGRMLADHTVKTSGFLNAAAEHVGAMAGAAKKTLNANPNLQKHITNASTIGGGVAGALQDPGIDAATGQRQSSLMNIAGGAALGHSISHLGMSNLHRPGTFKGPTSETYKKHFDAGLKG